MDARGVLGLVLLCVCRSAWAQPPDAEARCREAALYRERADVALREGRPQDAMLDLGQAVALCPTHEESRKKLEEVREQVIAQEVGARAAGRPGGPGGADPGPEEAHREHLLGSPRDELQLVQGLHGALWGAALGITLSGNSHVLGETVIPRTVNGNTVLLGALLGGTLGTAASSLLSRRPLLTGHVTALNSGTVWGAWLSGSLLVANGGGPALLIPAAAATGTVAGGLLGGMLRPRPGQVALVNSVGIWGTVLSHYALRALRPELETPAHLRLAAVSAGGGLLLGAAVAPWLRVSRLRMLLIDLGGAGGLAVGILGTRLLAQGAPPTPTHALAIGSATLSGLVLAAVLTRGMEVPAEAPVTLAPTLAPGAAGLSVMGAF